MLLISEGLALKLSKIDFLQFGALSGHQVGGLAPTLSLVRRQYPSTSDVIVKGDHVVVSLRYIGNRCVCFRGEEVEVSLINVLLLLFLLFWNILDESHPLHALRSRHWPLDILELKFLILIYDLSLSIVALCGSRDPSEMCIV